MIALQNTKVVTMLAPISLNGTAGTGIAVDTVGFDTATIILSVGVVGADFDEFTLQEATASGGSYTDITGTVFGTSTNIGGTTSVLPDADDNGVNYLIDVNLKGRSRWLKPTIDPGASATLVSCICILSRSSGITSASDRGAFDVLRA